MDKRFARDIMTRDVVTVYHDHPISELQRILSENNIAGAPVVNREGTLVGVVSTTDILSKSRQNGVGPNGSSTFYLHPDIAIPGELRAVGMHIEDDAETPVAEIMTPVVISCPPDATIAEVAERMGVNRVHRVLIQEGSTLVGVVSALDLVGLIPQNALRHTTAKNSEVLWATDLGSDSNLIAARAVRLGLDMSAKVTMLHVTPMLTTLMKAYGHREELGGMQQDFEETALARMQDLASKYLEGVVDYELIGRSGEPSEVIAEVISERRPEFVVIGAQRPPDARLSGLGSVAERILSESPVPVVTVPRRT